MCVSRGREGVGKGMGKGRGGEKKETGGNGEGRNGRERRGEGMEGNGTPFSAPTQKSWIHP